MSVTWKDVIPRPVTWESCTFLSCNQELEVLVKQRFYQRSATCAHRWIFVKNKVIFFFPMTYSTTNGATFFSWEQVICASCWLVQALPEVRECALSLIKVNFYLKIVLSDEQLWEILTSKTRTIGYIYFSAHQGFSHLCSDLKGSKQLLLRNHETKLGQDCVTVSLWEQKMLEYV